LNELTEINKMKNKQVNLLISNIFIATSFIAEGWDRGALVFLGAMFLLASFIPE